MSDSMRQTPTRHAEDGDLIRLIDREADQAERSAVAEHAMACPECRARLDALRRRTARLSALLEADAAAIPVPPLPRPAARPAVRRTPGWMRVAAAVALLIGIGVAAPPVRAWVAEQWDRVASLFEAAPEPAPSTSAAPREEGGATVRFAPQSEEFTVDVAHAQAEGRLVLRVAASTAASARVVGGGGEELLVRPSGLLIGNAAGSSSSYEVVVPEGLDVVRVRVGGREVAVVRPGAADGAGERVIELAPPR